MPATIGKKTGWAWVLATWFGVGLLKPGPGTYASAAALLLWIAAAHLLHPVPLGVVTALAAVVVTIVGIPASTIAARESGREDPGFVVIDEVAGQWIALIGVRSDWHHAILALVLFRIFDMWKPWPIWKLEALPDGTGIMLDDVAAGALALVVGLLLARWV